MCHDAMVETAKKRLKAIESELSSKHISFDSDSTLFDKISRFGEITVCNSIGSCLPVVDYKDKVRPVVSVGGRGSNEVQFFKWMCRHSLINHECVYSNKLRNNVR